MHLSLHPERLLAYYQGVSYVADVACMISALWIIAIDYLLDVVVFWVVIGRSGSVLLVVVSAILEHLQSIRVMSLLYS